MQPNYSFKRDRCEVSRHYQAPRQRRPLNFQALGSNIGRSPATSLVHSARQVLFVRRNWAHVSSQPLPFCSQSAARSSASFGKSRGMRFEHGIVDQTGLAGHLFVMLKHRTLEKLVLTALSANQGALHHHIRQAARTSWANAISGIIVWGAVSARCVSGVAGLPAILSGQIVSCT